MNQFIDHLLNVYLTLAGADKKTTRHILWQCRFISIRQLAERNKVLSKAQVLILSLILGSGKQKDDNYTSKNGH
jgi:hypothetical protein